MEVGTGGRDPEAKAGGRSTGTGRNKIGIISQYCVIISKG